MFPERLSKGYRAFLDGRFKEERGRYAVLADSGQSPSIMVIGCVDSRVSPEVIFDAAPGELLVARPNLPAQTAAGFQRALLSLTHAVSEGSFFDAPAHFKAATEEDYKAIEERLSAEAAFEE